jgi:trigger factor
MAQSDIKITFEDLKTFTTKKYPSANGKTNLLTQKFKELLLEFCRKDEVKDFLTKWLQRNYWNCSKKSKSYEEVTYDEFIAASYGE